MSTQQREDPALTLPAGTWQVDPAASSLEFRVKTMWGLATVKGTFGSYRGTLTVAEDGTAAGELSVDVESLDTKNAKRDKHLRSPDFFHSELHPTIRFRSTSITARPGGLTIAGDLHVGSKVASLQLPVTVLPATEGRLRLQSTGSVPREHVGLIWNRAGMIRGDVLLGGDIELVPSA